MPFSVLTHQLDSMPKVRCGVSRVAQARWMGVLGDREGWGGASPRQHRTPLMGAGRGHTALTLCKQKRISLGTGADFPSQSKMPKYLLYLDTGVFQETERGLYESLRSPPETTPSLPTRGGPKAHHCIGANPTCLPCPASPHWGTPKCPWPVAGSVGPRQPPLSRGERLRKAGRGPAPQWERAAVPDSGCHRALGARAAGAGRQRALKMVKPSHNKSFSSFPDIFFFLTVRKGKKVAFFTNLLLKVCHCSSRCLGRGPHSCHPPVAAGQPSLQRSPSPTGWLPSKEQQEKSWLLVGKRSQHRGRAGRESDAFPMLEHTILTSIPVIAATCWLSQPSPCSSPTSPSPLLGLLYGPPSPDMPFISCFRPRESCTRSASRTCKPSGAGGEFPTHP